MNHANRCAIVSLAALASTAPIAAAFFGVWPGVQPYVSLAVTGLVLLGLLFHVMLVRHLGAADTLAHVRRQYDSERQGREKAEAALADTHEALCRLVRQQEQVREAERNRIARDIHDDLGQHLLALKIEVQLASQGSGPAMAPAAGALERLAGTVDQTIAALRVVIDNLRPLALEDGLRVAIEQHLREFSRLHGIGYQLIAPLDGGAGGGADPGQRDLELVLLRILRESLANVVRHAQASEVWVALKRGGTDITLEIRDNGIGMAPSPPVQAGLGTGRQRCGLAGIAERVAAVGGSFTIDSGPGQGTVLSLSIPQPATPAARQR